MFSISNEVQNNYISPTLLMGYIKNINVKDIKLTQNKTETILNEKFENLKLLQNLFWVKDTIKELLINLTSVISTENSTHPIAKENNRGQIRDNVLSLINNFFIKIDGQLANVQGDEAWAKFINALYLGMDQVSDKRMNISLLFTTYNFTSVNLQATTNTRVTNFLNNANIDDFKYLYAKNPDWLGQNSIFINNFKSRAIKDRDIFIWLYDELKEDEKSALLKEVIKSGIATFISVYDDIASKIPNNAELICIMYPYTGQLY